MKNKLNFLFRSIILVTITVVLMLPTASVRADQVFLFSDDLSTQFNIDQVQTFAKFVSGLFYTADGSVSSAVVSKEIATPPRAIISARLDVTSFLPRETIITYYLSNNGGLNWMQINPGYTYTFDSAGNRLHWKAIIIKQSPLVSSASLDKIHLTYTVSDTLAPDSSIYSNHGSLNSIMYGGGGNLNSFVCDALSSIGLGCGAPQTVSTPSYGQSTPVFQDTPDTSDRQTDTGNYLQASIANITVDRTASDDEVILVKVPATNGIKPTLGLSTNDAIFEIIRGQKHFIPTVDIFFDYGFDLSAVQSITHEDLEPFPRSKLTKVHGDNKNSYYITEGLMIRLIPNKRVFESYGDREEDVITISKKEFNFYPRNQYVFLENPLSADVYQIVNDGTKRYVVPQVMKRLRINKDQAAPINQAQLDAYKISAPIIF